MGTTVRCTIYPVDVLDSIRSKADARVFVEKFVIKGQNYSIIVNGTNTAPYAIVIEKEKNGVIFAYDKHGDLSNPFIPLVEIARGTDAVAEIVWKYRKLFNHKYLYPLREE